MDDIKRSRGWNRKGIKLSDETKQKIRDANVGKTLSEETRRKMSEASLGKRHSKEWNAKISIAHGGNGAPKKWSQATKRWARLIKERDGCCFICQTTEELEAHHILQKVKYPEYAIELWNGITLCKTHHIQKHKEFN